MTILGFRQELSPFSEISHHGAYVMENQSKSLAEPDPDLERSALLPTIEGVAKPRKPPLSKDSFRLR